ncbi:MAG: hypothetical protein RR140_01970 [Clostridia bacterium]
MLKKKAIISFVTAAAIVAGGATYLFFFKDNKQPVPEKKDEKLVELNNTTLNAVNAYGLENHLIPYSGCEIDLIDTMASKVYATVSKQTKTSNIVISLKGDTQNLKEHILKIEAGKTQDEKDRAWANFAVEYAKVMKSNNINSIISSNVQVVDTCNYEQMLKILEPCRAYICDSNLNFTDTEKTNFINSVNDATVTNFYSGSNLNKDKTISQNNYLQVATIGSKLFATKYTFETAGDSLLKQVHSRLAELVLSGISLKDAKLIIAEEIGKMDKISSAEAKSQKDSLNAVTCKVEVVGCCSVPKNFVLNSTPIPDAVLKNDLAL